MELPSTKMCRDCGNELPLTDFHKGCGHFGRKPWCKKCTRERELRRRELDPLHAKLTIMADGILKRTKYVHCTPFNRSYKERGIQCLIGDNLPEVRDFLKVHFGNDVLHLMESGENPSVDRIDPYGHYELTNIQIISMKENRNRADMSYRNRPITVEDAFGNIQSFKSIKEASQVTGYSYSHISNRLAAKRPNSAGTIFKYVESEVV